MWLTANSVRTAPSSIACEGCFSGLTGRALASRVMSSACARKASVGAARGVDRALYHSPTSCQLWNVVQATSGFGCSAASPALSSFLLLLSTTVGFSWLLDHL